MIKDLLGVKTLALKIDEQINSQLGCDNYLQRVSWCSVKKARHKLPKNYAQDYYIIISSENNIQIQKLLKIPNELEGILIFHEQTNPLQFANSELS